MYLSIKSILGSNFELMGYDSSDRIVAKRYGVILKNREGMVMMGHAITHLQIDEWADLHGYHLMESHYKREAYAHERTDLY